MGFLHFCRAGPPSGNSIYALLIAAFASKGDQSRSRICSGRCHRFRHHPACCCCATAGSGADCSAATSNTAGDAVACQYQFRSVGRRGGDESRQQFPGTPWRSGVVRVQPRAAQQSGRRRRVRSDGRAAFPDLGRGLRNLGQDRRAGRFHRRPASDRGRRRRARRAPCTRRQRRRFD